MNYDIVFECGAIIGDVEEPVPVGTPITVWCNESGGRRPMLPMIENAAAQCLACPCRRKSGRKEIMFYRKADVKCPPTGLAVSCKVKQVVEKENSNVKN